MSVIEFRIARATRTQPLGLHFWRWAGTRHLRLLAFPLNCLISQVNSTLWFPLCSFLRNLNFAKLSPTYGLVHAKRHQLFNSLTIHGTGKLHKFLYILERWNHIRQFVCSKVKIFMDFGPVEPSSHDRFSSKQKHGFNTTLFPGGPPPQY